MEQLRLDALSQLDVLDTRREQGFDRIVNLIKATLGVPVALVSMIDGHRQWYKAWEGLAGPEAALDTTFCQYTVRQASPVIVPDASADARFKNNPHVTGAPHIMAYAGVPLRTSDGYNIGTLCALDLRAREFSESQIAILGALAQLTVELLELRQRAATDALTNLLSRRAFKETGAMVLALAQRHGHPLAAAVLDLDHFKSINDTRGHAAGDKVLVEVARAASAALRKSDVIGRLGGEEFALLLPETKPHEALGVAEKVRSAIENLNIVFEGRPIKVTASLGVASLTAAVGDADTLIARADAALYQAKSEGRNRTAAWHPTGGEPQGVRRRTLKSGRIIFNNGALTVDCTVNSLADDGAGLCISNSFGIPKNFKLVIRQDNFETECRVLSQTPRHLEVAFV